MYKGNFNNKMNDYNKKEKELKEKDLLILELKNSGNKFINMIKDRENLIQNYTAKIEELSASIAQKDEQLKLMVNFSKEISKENKSNVQELTKQAVKTIKIFYNTLNNNNLNAEQGEGGLIEIKPPQNEEDFVKDLETALTNGKTRMYLQDGLNKALFIPPNQKYISKEFLLDNNFKSNLVKMEFFSALLRESRFIEFLKDLFQKIAPKSGDGENEDDPDKHNQQFSLEQLVRNVISFKTTFDFVIQEKERLEQENKKLLAKQKETELYIAKLKADLKKYSKKMNDKLEFIDKAYGNRNKELKDEITFLKSKNREECDSQKEELKKLRMENDKVKNINLNLNNALVDRDNITLQLQQDNNNLIKELTVLKTKLNELQRGKSNANNQSQIQNSSFKNSPNSPNEEAQGFDDQNQQDYKNRSKSLRGNAKGKRPQEGEYADNDDPNNPSNNNSYVSKPEERKTYVVDFTPNSRSKPSSNNYRNKSNSPYKMENPDRFSYEIVDNQYNQREGNNLDSNGICQFCSRYNSVISDYVNAVPYQNFYDLAKTYLRFPNEMNNLFYKVDDINRKILDAKSNLERNQKDKKIKISHIIDIMDQIQRLLSYLSQKISKTNNDFKSKAKDFEDTTHFISELCFDGRDDYEKDMQKEPSINKNTFDINLNLSNSSSPYVNNVQNNNEQEEEGIVPIEDIKQFFEINIKIFSSSELMKFYSIYEGHNIEEVLQIFGNNCSEIKEAISKMRFDIETDTSDLEEADLKWNKKKRVNETKRANESSAYKIVNEKILSLKKFEFNFSILMEIVKNYFVALEMLLKHIQPDMEEEENPDELRGRKNIVSNAVNNLYGIFEDTVYFKIDEMEDDIIFNRKVITRLLFNHKQYLFIALDF